MIDSPLNFNFANGVTTKRVLPMHYFADGVTTKRVLPLHINI
jgi:hypothetical protein